MALNLTHMDSRFQRFQFKVDADWLQDPDLPRSFTMFLCVYVMGVSIIIQSQAVIGELASTRLDLVFRTPGKAQNHLQVSFT